MDQQAAQPMWRRSRSCATNACVEVAKIDNTYLIRDSKSPETRPLAFTAEEWTAFTAGVAAGEFTFD